MSNKLRVYCTLYLWYIVRFLCAYTTIIKCLFIVLTVAILLCALCYNMPSARTKRLRDKQRYESAKESICVARKEYYRNNATKCKESEQIAYNNDSERKKEASRKAYDNDPKRLQKKVMPMTPKRKKRLQRSLCQ